MPTQTQPQHEGGPTAVPRPEYPRPQFTRPEWLCLNGPWEFEIDRGDSGLERGLAGAGLSGAITVPFCPESELSGVGDTDFMEAVWYRRTVRIPAAWTGRRVLLHFQAVDHDATVWVNGVEVARHRGGFTPSPPTWPGSPAPAKRPRWSCAPATAGTAPRPAASRPPGTPTPGATTRAPPGSGRPCGWNRSPTPICGAPASPRTWPTGRSTCACRCPGPARACGCAPSWRTGTARSPRPRRAPTSTPRPG
ncbi:sugar-binding domain-containing protein [Nocardiopsis composta]